MPLTRDASAIDPNVEVGVNVPVAMPGMFCALGPVDVAGLWGAGDTRVNPLWRPPQRPIVRPWKPFDPGHRGGF